MSCVRVPWLGAWEAFLHLSDQLLHVLQVLSPFVDPVTKSKVEFVTTSEYEVSKGAKASSSSWFGSSSSSWFSSSKTSSKQEPLQSSSDADIDVVVEEDQARKHQGPGTFGPILPFYKNTFCFDRHQALLRTAGIA
jgi:hypothetical protein